ncbi:hypothetical protein EJB05_25166, partial [Eragrostis curvula]
MASATTSSTQTSNSLNKANPAVQMHPELLKAAKRGDCRKLGDLISQEGAFVIDIEEEHGEPPVRSTHTYAPDSILHAVASGGDDGDKFLTSATMICDKTKHLLLSTRNAKGDTPFHCAARGGSVKMLSHLIDLAGREGGDDGGGGGGGRASRLQLALRKQNDGGETALHEAVRWGDEEMVDVLMSADPGLAGFPRNDGASPLYLAILLGYDDIAEQLYEKDNRLSYSGPDGQNALHVAVLRSERMTRKLLTWNENLTKEGDGSKGRTPLHYAASWGYDYKRPERPIDQRLQARRAKLLLEGDESSAYQSDNNGLFPIHAAALGSNLDVVLMLLKMCPDCTQLRDDQGRTFLHIAVSKNGSLFWLIFCNYLGGPNRLHIQKDAGKVRRFASVVNAQDNEGNTALHLAAMAGSPLIMLPLIWTKEVQLNLQNKKGETALDLSLRKMPSGVFYGLDPNLMIYNLLVAAGARFGVHKDGEKEQAPALDEKKMAETIKDSTTTIGVVSVLIITVTFAAAFQLPGGYNTSDKPGTPQLAKNYSFEAFLVANNLSLFCSTMATISLMYAGVSTVDITTRMAAFVISIFFLNGSARSLIAAFAFGSFAVLAPVAGAAAALDWLGACLLLADIAWFTFMLCLFQIVLINRLGIKQACFCTAASMVGFPLGALWPYIVIAGFMAYLKIQKFK